MNLENRVIIVTGASSGIGRLTALALADKGAKVVLTARREEKLQAVQQEIEATDGEALVVVGDITLAETAEHIVKRTVDAYGRIDVLINNAGYGPPASILETTEELWDVTLATCLKSVYLMTRAVLPEMLQQESGHIVQISSVAGKKGFANRGAYCAAKWGVQGFTEALRDEVGDQGIRASTIHPGAVATEWWGKTNDAQPDAVMERMVQPEQVVEAIVYVLSQPENIHIDEVTVNTFRSAWADA